MAKKLINKKTCQKIINRSFIIYLLSILPLIISNIFRLPHTLFIIWLGLSLAAYSLTNAYLVIQFGYHFVGNNMLGKYNSIYTKIFFSLGDILVGLGCIILAIYAVIFGINLNKF